MTYFGCFFWTLTKNELFLHSRGINFPPRPKTMAKGSAMGLWRGKKGSSVFYRIANSNNNMKQGIRERAYEISNPRTTSQAGQRMKLLPAQRVYGVLKPIISRGWQGVKYGVESKQEYLKNALRMSTGYPFLEKDSDVVVPGNYQITKGTLQQITTRLSDDPDVHITSLLGRGLETQTVGGLTKAIMARSPYVQSGDQLTLVGCAKTSNGELIWGWNSVILDENDTTALDSVSIISHDETIWLNPAPSAGADDALLVQTTHWALVASSVILSRLGDNGQYLRSTAILTVNEESLQDYFNGAAYRRARNSYMNPTRTQLTDWPIEPEIPENSYISDYALSGLTGAKAVCNGIVVKVTRNEETDALTGVFVTTYLGGNALVKKSDGTAVTYEATSQGETQILPITPADQSELTNLPTIPYE